MHEVAGDEHEQDGGPNPAAIDRESEQRQGADESENEELKRASHDPMRFVQFAEFLVSENAVHRSQVGSSEMRLSGAWQIPARTR